jgi:hypothetical protein
MFGLFPKVQFYRAKSKKTAFDRLLATLRLRKILYIEEDQSPTLLYLERRIEEVKRPHEVPCLLLDQELPLEKKHMRTILPTRVNFIFIRLDQNNKIIKFETESKFSFQ